MDDGAVPVLFHAKNQPIIDVHQSRRPNEKTPEARCWTGLQNELSTIPVRGINRRATGTAQVRRSLRATRSIPRLPDWHEPSGSYGERRCTSSVAVATSISNQTVLPSSR